MQAWCRVTPGGGNPRESATENRPPMRAWVRVKRWGKSPPRGWQQARQGKPHQEQCRIGIARGAIRRAACAPADPGWQLDPVSNGGTRGMVIHGAARPPDRTRLTGHPRKLTGTRAARPAFGHATRRLLTRRLLQQQQRFLPVCRAAAGKALGVSGNSCYLGRSFMARFSEEDGPCYGTLTISALPLRSRLNS